MGLDENKSYGIGELAKISKVKRTILQSVFNRGVGAARTNPTSIRLLDFSKNPSPAIPRSARLSDEAWGYSRLYSFLNRGKTYFTADADLAKAARY
jgi:hypothetical protein